MRKFCTPIQQIEIDKGGSKRWEGWNMQEGYREKTPQCLHFGKHHHCNIDLEKDDMPRRPTSPGLHMGLSLLLDVQEDEYYCTGTKSTGFKGLLHMPISQPRIYEHGFAMAPGMTICCAVRNQVMIKMVYFGQKIPGGNAGTTSLKPKHRGRDLHRDDARGHSSQGGHLQV